MERNHYEGLRGKKSVKKKGKVIPVTGPDGP
jgi:hypothetical protein